MSVTESRPTLPDWLNLDEVISPDSRRGLEEQVRIVAEKIVEVREVFEVARAYQQVVEHNTGADLPEDVFELVQDHYSQLGLLWDLLYRFSEVISPEAAFRRMDDQVERLDQTLARVPGLR